MERDEVFDELAKRGAAKAVVPYSGGGDEGGVDDYIRLFDAADVEIALLKEASVPGKLEDVEVRGRKTTRWVEDRSKMTADELLAEALCRPVEERWGGFSGDFHVSGTVIWDVATRKVIDSNTSTSTNYESSEDEV